jgi:hypothetical protein
VSLSALAATLPVESTNNTMGAEIVDVARLLAGSALAGPPPTLTQITAATISNFTCMPPPHGDSDSPLEIYAPGEIG